MIKPTVGRVLWYYPRGGAEGPPLAAIVACVWSDTCVNLAIFNASGTPMSDPPTSVLLVQEGNPRPTGGNFCEWMPFQVGQAKRHAELDPAPVALHASEAVEESTESPPASE